MSSPSGAFVVRAHARVGFAPNASDLLKRGIAAYDRLEYRRAVELLEAASRTSLTRDELILCYRTLGFSYGSLGEAAPAEKAFARLLRVAPSTQLDRTVSPKLRAFFNRARAKFPDERIVRAVLPELLHGPEVQPPGLRLHLDLFDRQGAKVALAGSEESPRLVPVAAPVTPWYRRRWVWGVVGGVIAATAVGTAVGLTIGRDRSSQVTVIAR